MKQPRVSIVMRTFERPDMLRRALTSVAEQTWPNREAVIVNDGGVDVQSLVDEFQDQIDIVYLNYSRSDKPGRSGAANAAIEAASGEYIAYLDDDDIYYPNHLQELMERAVETGAPCLYTFSNCGTEEPCGDGTYKVTDVVPGTNKPFSRAAFFTNTFIHLSTFCHQRQMYDDHGGFDLSLDVLEDIDLFIRYSTVTNFECIPVVTTQYHIRTDRTNAVTSMHDEWAETRQRLGAKYMQVAIKEMMFYIDEGRASLQSLDTLVKDLTDRVRDLEGQLNRLKSEAPSDPETSSS